MKYGITLIVSLLVHLSLLGQVPANDECTTAIALGVAPNCEQTTIYTNVEATATDIGDFNLPSCYQGGSTDRDVWFSFTPSDTIEDYRITVTGVDDNGQSAIINPQIAIYRGSCGVNMLAELVCATGQAGQTDAFVDLFGPDLGLTYYIRVNDFGGAGSFNLCVDARPPISLIDEGGSQTCSGFLFDTGGPDGNYGDNENHAFVICPDQPTNCINIGFEFYNIESFNDNIVIYDGDNIGAPVVANINASGFISDGISNGAVCFEASASSGCMTVQFMSDGQVNFEGFSAYWECSSTPCEEVAAITVDPDVTAEEMALAIAGAETQLTVTSLDCPDGNYGTFTGDNSDLGLGRGILLSSGSAEYAIGPNNSTGGGLPSTGNSGPGDANLDSLTVIETGDTTRSEDACILELDVFANTQELVFEYVFGSEEYPEFVEDFNDVFAFFISGPGITGIPALDNQVNIAVLPNGEQTTVEINGVNNEENYQYYRNNAFGQSVQYDGLTSDFLGVKKSLTARADVIPCNTYHLKLAIADRGDDAYASGVFVSDIKGGAPTAFIDFTSGLDYLVEDCVDVPDTLVVQLQNNNPGPVTYAVNVGGTATEDIDFLFPTLPDSITFQPGFNEFRYPIVILSDLLTEGTETIDISFVIDFGCGAATVSSVSIDLRDQLLIEINGGADTILYCVGSTVDLTATGAEFFSWSPAGIFEDPLGATVVAMPTGDQVVTVIGTLGTCVDSTSVLLLEVDPMIEIQNQPDTLLLCEGDTVTVTQINNVNSSNLTWSGFNAVNGLLNDTLIIVPTFFQEISVSVELGGCVATDSFFVDPDFLSIPTVFPDTTVCEDTPLQLANSIFGFETNYEWTPGEDFDDPTDPGSLLNISTPGMTTYTLVSTTLNGVCADTQMVTVNYTPATLEILDGDLVEVCSDYDSLVLNAVVTPPGSDIMWSPQSGVLTDFGDSISVRPTITVTYVATTQLAACILKDTVTVKVDSLPVDMTITLDPFKDPYCQGDTFFLISPIYDVGDFSSIVHQWMDAPGLQTGDSLYNGFVLAQDTSLFQRITTNGACSRTDSVQVNVVTPPDFSLTPMDTSICPGGFVPFVFEILDGTMGTVTWTPDDGSLSCTDCFTPIATPTTSTEYMVELMAEGSDCSFPISATVGILPPTQLNVTTSNLICPGDQVSPFVGPQQVGVTYRVTGNGIDTTDPTISFIPTASGEYTYTAFGPCDTVSVVATVTLIDSVEVSFDAPAEACAGDVLNLTAMTTAPATQEGFFLWTANGEEVGALRDLELTLDDAGTVILVVTYTNACETVSATATIQVNVAPSLQLPPDTTICPGQSLVLNLDPDGSTTTYSWTGTDGFTSTDPAPVVSPTQTTTYTVTASSGGQCPDQSGSVTVTVVEDYTLSASEDMQICAGSEVTLSASVEPASTMGEFIWTLPDGTNISGATISDTPLASGTYTVTFQDDTGCFPASTETVFVEVLEEIVAPEITAIDSDGNVLEFSGSVFNGEVITFTAADVPGTLNYTYSWTGNGEPATADGQTIQVTAPAPPGSEPSTTLSYTVTATSDPGGCTASATFSLTVNRARYELPDLITPNGDGTNDAFRLYYNGVVTDYSLMIFNRWGQEVFESTDPDAGWDGTKDGTPQSMDVYLYRVRFTQNGVQEERDGQFSLVR